MDIKENIKGYLVDCDGYETGNYVDIDEIEKKYIVIDTEIEINNITYHIEGHKELTRTYYRSQTHESKSEEEWFYYAEVIVTKGHDKICTVITEGTTN